MCYHGEDSCLINCLKSGVLERINLLGITIQGAIYNQQNGVYKLKSKELTTSVRIDTYKTYCCEFLSNYQFRDYEFEISMV